MFDLTFCVIVDCRAANLLLNLSGQFYKPILGKKFGICVKTTIKIVKEKFEAICHSRKILIPSAFPTKISSWRISKKYISGRRSRLHQNSLRNWILIRDADGFAYCVGDLSNFLFTKSRANDLGKMQSSQTPSLEFSLDKDLHCKLCSMQTTLINNLKV